MSRTSNQLKGDALEDAVRGIESAILRASPALAEGTFEIESKKIVVANAVRHEIDLYVTVRLGPGYDSVFVFECKNWESGVSKNDIIVFSEKIRATRAQTGFFVAKDYSRDAVAQATQDHRIVLLTAAELDPSGVMVPAGFHGIHLGHTQATILVHAHPDGEDKGTPLPIDPTQAMFALNGEIVDFSTLAPKWIVAARDEASNHFASGRAEAGIHKLSFAKQHSYGPHEATLNGKPVRRIDITGTVDVEISKAIVVSAFEVATRGRHTTVQLRLAGAEIKAGFVEVPVVAV